MPPRFAYWTIIVDSQPTAFRAATLEDIMPTFNRLKEKRPTAVLRWFQQGQLWNTPLDAREALQKRREQGRKPGGPRERRQGPPEAVPWTPKGQPETSRPDRKARPTGPKTTGASPRSAAHRPEWKPRGPGVKTAGERARPNVNSGAWKPPKKEASAIGDRPAWRPKNAATPRQGQPDRRAAGAEQGRRPERPEWKPKAAATDTNEGKKASGSQGERRDRTWRPGGDHKDPRQKYKDAKKAKWTRFKQTIRARSSKRKP